MIHVFFGYLLSVCLLSCFVVYGNKNNAHEDTTVDRIINSKMRILFIVDKFPWYTKVIILNQITGLLDRGHDVYIYAHKGASSEVFDSEVYKYDLLNRTYYGCLPDNLDTYDIIVCQYADLGKEFSKLKMVLGLKAKLVTFLRGADISKYVAVAPHEFDELFEECDLFLPICDYFKYRLILLGCDPGKIVVSYSPINCSRFNYKKRVLRLNEPVHIVSVARLAEEKGLIYCIQAFDKLCKKYPNIKYTIVGEGNDRDMLTREINDRGLGKKIKLVGWATQEQVAHILDTAHIFLLPSVVPDKGSSEAIPNAIKEALLMGLPVIATHHGGTGELIRHGENGFLVPERDFYAIESRLSYLIEHPEVWPSIGKRGREHVIQMFDMEVICDQLEKIFYNLINKK